MTAESSDRTVVHVELDVADSGMHFNAGDAVGVLPQNAAPLVTGLLARLGLDGDAVFEVQAASGEGS
jgi:sulfite reductase (NADPH) flavoprotein alpha-component